MGRYNVDTEEIQKAVIKLKTVYVELDRASAKITRAYNLIYDLSSAQTRQCAYDIWLQGGLYDKQWANVKHIEDALVNSCATIHLAEIRAKQMLNDNYELKEDEIVAEDWKPKGENDFQDFAVDMAQALIGKCGVVGTVISSAWKVSEDCNGLTVLKGANNTVKSIASAVIKKGTKVAGETVKKKGFIEGFTEQLKDGIGDFKVKNYNTKKLKHAESTRCATEWAGVVIDGALNFVDNVQEFDGDMSNGRLYQETIVETTVSWGVDFVRGAALTALFTPLVGPAAPWVAAGAGVLCDWAMDKTSKLIFGNDDGWVENVSDGIIDLAQGVHDKAKNLKDTIGKGISSIGKCLTTVWAS